ncbi:PREDICTED: protein LTV1 homolog [Nanorana parkeri]|uniref:protein LTV1 homolog n=1 Tax=Nanorana parkeri TaxID=125878 RepID=UPI000854550C|nr:PREDICTED: protein LTV1 homolog [Nanorana parkeri]
MPHRKKKPFIEKKKAVTFHLVHRSQRDPLAADETAPQRVLLPADKVDAEKRRDEQRKFGVFFDDDYNYLQHLKNVGPAELVPSDTGRSQSRIIVTHDGKVEDEVEHISPPTLNLPSSVFASEFEEDVGLLNKAAPVRGLCLDLDPDVVAALDDDFDFSDPENQLDDDFIIKANDPSTEAQRNQYDGDDDEWEDVDDDDEEEDGDESQDDEFDSDGPLSDDESRGEGGPMKEFLFMQEETKSRFSQYSISSSVMRRNDQLTLLDERFEKFYEQFDEDEIGALDNAELEGFIQANSARLQDVVDDYFKQKAKECVKLKDLKPTKGLDLIEEDEEEKEEMETIVIEAPTEKWDCESILSTYSNLYNHPQIIKDPPKTKPIKVSAKTGIPLGVLPGKGLTAKQVERMERINDGDLPRVSTQQRSKDESAEERKARKQAIKEERKDRRMEKKSNKLAFKVEKSRQEKEQLNLRQNLQGLKLS